jgi:pimeloyl-ACP methyl ester carboxylesterase
MERIVVSGVGLAYELLGEPGRPAVALTPGGRFGGKVPGLTDLAEALVAGGRRVLLWDRPNCGASDLCLEDDNESALQGRLLTELIRALELGPTAVGGGSSGSRTSLFAARHDPALISHLMVWWISGGVASILALGASYYGAPAIVARMRGLEAVLDLPNWVQVRDDPKKREAFLRQDPDTFVATMERWAASFVYPGSSPVPGMSPDDFARLTMPTLVLRGGRNDIYHPLDTSEEVHRLIGGATIVDPPWPPDWPLQRLGNAGVSDHFLDWPKLAPLILQFTQPR